jgi:hypothetical protein
MKTALELNRDGSRTVFHRTATAAWTHAPGERYQYRTRTRDEAGRNHWAWIEMRCDCQVSNTADGQFYQSERYSAPVPPTDDTGARTKAGA